MRSLSADEATTSPTDELQDEVGRIQLKEFVRKAEYFSSTVQDLFLKWKTLAYDSS
jgi:hypothetical protein